MNLDPDVIFGPKGALAHKLPYYEFRPSQVAYAKAVRQAIADKRIALLEAQTGTGKTLAYLIPALESRRRIIISTGTKALQEQLYFKDIPLLRNQLGLEFEYILMKGRMNYLCLLKYERLQTEPLLPDEESVDQFQEIHDWVEKTDTGDIAESGVPESSPLWRSLTIPSDSCQGSKCRFYDRCFVFRVKQRAEKAQVLVVNHHLFFADLSLQVQSGTSIFPAYDVVVFDEAHQLADVATHNLSVQFSQEGFRELYDDLIRELKILEVREKLEMRAASDYARRLGEALAVLFEKFRAMPQKARYDSHLIAKIVGGDGEGVDRLFISVAEELIKVLDRTEDLPQVARRLLSAQSSLGFLLRGNDPAYVYWAEHNDFREWTLRASPLDVSGLLKQSLWPNLHAAVLTSATLFIDQSCTAVKQDLGLQEALEETFPYNFDYPSQACLYVPKHLPEPTDPRFAAAAAEEIVRIVDITGGGAFVLCTSWGNLKVYEQALRQTDYPLLVQGKKSKQVLMKSFLRNRGSVLLATMSFWQGIDVQGDALVSVIIDKLPFAVPNDPMIEAKIQYLKKLGKNPFNEYQLPSAVMLLKQGAGRLIRTSVDYGILAVLDRRLLTRNYGEVFLRNLPPITQIHRLEELARAFEERREKYVQYHDR